MAPKLIALIPARSGSKRIPDKNIRDLGGHPLIAYTVRSAIESEIFSNVFCVTNSQKYAQVAEHYGAEVPALRPEETAGDASPDIQWIEWVAQVLQEKNVDFDAFAILRPTSPFRKAQTLQRAWQQFKDSPEVDSLRAVELCAQHPGKMWTIRNNRMHPLLPFSIDGVPWHSNQYTQLPNIYIQNASLEIAWKKTLVEQHSIAGEAVMSFLTEDLEGFDINAEIDFQMAEQYINSYSNHCAITTQPYTL